MTLPQRVKEGIVPPVVFHSSVNRLLTTDETLAIVGLGRTEWLERTKDGRAPAPVRLSAKIVRWRLSDLQQWIADLPLAA